MTDAGQLKQASVKIPLSLVESADKFAAALEAHRAALAAHSMGEPNEPAPIAHELLAALIRRIPESGPVESRGPDRFEIAPYEIVDDRPPPPTLAERKQELLDQLNQAAQAAVNRELSPARVRLLNLEYGDAVQKPVAKRTAAEKATVKEYTRFSARCADIGRIVTRAAVAIEDLTDSKISKWKAPSFD